MAATELCTEDEVTRLVHRFYAKAREDHLLGPIFKHHVADRDRHLAKLADFWSAHIARHDALVGGTHAGPYRATRTGRWPVPTLAGAKDHS